MKKFRFLFAFLLMVTAIGFTACSDDDEDTDVRDQAVGNYSGTMNYYLLSGDKLVTIPEMESESITTATVSKEGSQALLLNIEGDIIKLSKVTGASNGFCFDFDGDVTLTEDGETITFSGYNGYNLTSTNASATKYHGGFINNKLEFYLQGTMEGFDTKVIVEISLTKK